MGLLEIVQNFGIVQVDESEFKKKKVDESETWKYNGLIVYGCLSILNSLISDTLSQ